MVIKPNVFGSNEAIYNIGRYLFELNRRAVFLIIAANQRVPSA